MRLADTKAINETISALIRTRKINTTLSSIFAIRPNSERIIFNTEKEWPDDTLMAAVILKMLERSGSQAQAVTEKILNELVANSHVFHYGELEGNPYYRNIKISEAKRGRFTLTEGRYSDNQLLNYNEPVMDEDGIYIPSLGLIDHDFSYPCIREGDETWMAVTPNEIYTMKKPVKEAHGRVLTLGLGLGYYAYMTAMKDSVESVTIIEYQPEVIALFEEYILPRFICRDKITVLQGDAISFMQNLKDGEYDYCFADIWQGNADSSSYLKLKEICRGFSRTKMAYWIEESIVQSLMGYVIVEIAEAGCKNRGEEVPEAAARDEEDRFKRDYIKKLLENESAERPQQLLWYADYRNILNLISRH